MSHLTLSKIQKSPTIQFGDSLNPALKKSDHDENPGSIRLPTSPRNVSKYAEEQLNCEKGNKTPRQRSRSLSSTSSQGVKKQDATESDVSSKGQKKSSLSDGDHSLDWKVTTTVTEKDLDNASKVRKKMPTSLNRRDSHHNKNAIQRQHSQDDSLSKRTVKQLSSPSEDLPSLMHTAHLVSPRSPRLLPRVKRAPTEPADNDREKEAPTSPRSASTNKKSFEWIISKVKKGPNASRKEKQEKRSSLKICFNSDIYGKCVFNTLTAEMQLLNFFNLPENSNWSGDEYLKLTEAELSTLIANNPDDADLDTIIKAVCMVRDSCKLLKSHEEFDIAAQKRLERKRKKGIKLEHQQELQLKRKIEYQGGMDRLSKVLNLAFQKPENLRFFLKYADKISNIDEFTSEGSIGAIVANLDFAQRLDMFSKATQYHLAKADVTHRETAFRELTLSSYLGRAFGKEALRSELKKLDKLILQELKQRDPKALIEDPDVFSVFAQDILIKIYTDMVPSEECRKLLKTRKDDILDYLKSKPLPTDTEETQLKDARKLLSEILFLRIISPHLIELIPQSEDESKQNQRKALLSISKVINAMSNEEAISSAPCPGLLNELNLLYRHNQELHHTFLDLYSAE